MRLLQRLDEARRRWPWWGQAALWLFAPFLALAGVASVHPEGRRRPWFVAAAGVFVLYAVIGASSSGDTDSSGTELVSGGRGDKPAVTAEGPRAVDRPTPPSTTMSTTTTSTTTPRPVAAGVPDGEDTTVTSVTDGDTIVVLGGERVRLIGVDTPETKDPRTGVQCFGREASAYTERTVPPGTEVRLVFDVERTDRYGRTLAYVYRIDDRLFVNAALVGDGYAQVATFPPNVRHADEFLVLQQEARDAGRGLWSACTGAAPSSPSTTSPSTEPAPAPGSDCHPSYPDVCIPPAPPDLNCADVPHKDIRVVTPANGDRDPHGFDGNNDDWGCES